MSTKPCVLVVGGVGKTARSVLEAILDSDAFHIVALVRTLSQTKPAVESLRKKGVEIRIGDIQQDSVEKLQSCLEGVDILTSLVQACEAGVGSVVPCDFGTYCFPGTMAMNDQKLAIQSFVRELGVTYTFIDVGWWMWMQRIFPHPLQSPSPGLIKWSGQCYDDGNIKSAVTSFEDIGRFVARIIADPRTANRYVFCWGEQVTLNEVYPVTDRVSGEKLSTSVVSVTADEVLQRIAEGKAKGDALSEGYYEYVYSMYTCGDNTVEKAKANGALDARELYPDFKPENLEQCAKRFYTNVPDYAPEP
ncbi:NAD-P-binding protein [Gautieria morchelliformis]|nr:NAD-P-binding protein [Gautieria morchelliformis]